MTDEKVALDILRRGEAVSMSEARRKALLRATPADPLPPDKIEGDSADTEATDQDVDHAFDPEEHRDG